MDTEGWLGMEFEWKQTQSFCFATASDSRGHPVPSGSVFVGHIPGWSKENLLGNNHFQKKFFKKGRKWGGLGRGRIAVNTSSNDLHNIQPYSSLACSPTLGSLFWLTTFLWTSETLYSHSPETPVDPHIWCYHNKHWSSSNSHKRMQATHTGAHERAQTRTHTRRHLCTRNTISHSLWLFFSW